MPRDFLVGLVGTGIGPSLTPPMHEREADELGLRYLYRRFDLDALVVRLLLVHEYRRAVLKDPLLPADLLPEDWPGAAARDLCATIYRTVAPAAEAWLDANATTDTGPLPPAGAAFAAG